MDYGEASGNHSNEKKYAEFSMQISTINPVSESGRKSDSLSYLDFAENLGHSNPVSSSSPKSASIPVNPQSRAHHFVPKPTIVQFVEKNGVSSDHPLHQLGKETDRLSNVDSQVVAEIPHETSVPSKSWMQSPPIQAMERLAVDSNRIPSSVFGRPSSPLEWSVASNDSLFSIRIGNNSFPRDHKIIEESYKLAELTKSVELASGEELFQSGDTKRQIASESSTESAITGVEIHKNIGGGCNGFPRPLIDNQVIINGETMAQSSPPRKKKKSSFRLPAICCCSSEASFFSSCKHVRHCPGCVCRPESCSHCGCAFRRPRNCCGIRPCLSRCVCWPESCKCACRRPRNCFGICSCFGRCLCWRRNCCEKWPESPSCIGKCSGCSTTPRCCCGSSSCCSSIGCKWLLVLPKCSSKWCRSFFRPPSCCTSCFS